VNELKGDELFFGYPEFKNMLCDFDQMKSLPLQPCFEYTKILNSSEVVNLLDPSRPQIEITENIKLFGDMFSQNKTMMKAYGKYEISIDHSALETEALNRTVAYFNQIEAGGKSF
jgi:hypothetical protein